MKWHGAPPSSYDGWIVDLVEDPQPEPSPDQVIMDAGLVVDWESGVPVRVRRTWASRDKTRDELVPREVPFGAFVAALKLAGIESAAVAGMIAQIPDAAARIVTETKWERATIAERDDPILRQFGAALGFTDAQVDQLFVTAKQIW